MFGIGTGELVVLFILILLIYGPQKLPELAAKIGKFTRDARDALDDVKSAMNEPKEEVKKWGQDMMIPPPPETHDDLPPDEKVVREEEAKKAPESKGGPPPVNADGKLSDHEARGDSEENGTEGPPKVNRPKGGEGGS